MMTSEKYFIKILKSFVGALPHFGPSKCVVSENDHPSSGHDPTFFIAESFPTQKMWMFAKKLELNTSRFDQDIRGLSSNKHFQKLSSAGFQDFSKKISP